MSQITAYLQRIGYQGIPKNDYNTLHDLQRLHLQSVPYENLDIMRGIPISLDVGNIFEKIVLRGRGGYCFELNALFAWLLRCLGFDVTDYMARFLQGTTEIPMRRHRVLKVTCAGEEYLVDVGCGRVIPRKPLPIIAGNVSEQNGEKYVLENEDFLGYVLYEWRQDSWRRIYSFTDEPQLEQDFTAVSFYCEAHPDSFFRTQDMVHIFTDGGRKTVAGGEVRLFTAGGVKVITPATKEVYHELLHTHFGIRM